MKGYVRGSTNTDKFPVRDAVQLEEGSTDAGTLGADSETTLREDARHKGSPERDSIHRKRPEQANPQRQEGDARLPRAGVGRIGTDC